MKDTSKRVEYSNENFRKNINYLLKRDGITKTFLDTELDMAQGSLSRYCRTSKSITEPKISMVNSLAKYFKVKIDDLINSDIEEQDKKVIENSQRKDILFCNRLIWDTKHNFIQWEHLDVSNYDHIEILVDYYEEHRYYSSNFCDAAGNFKSKFTYDLYDINELKGFIVKINYDTRTRVLLIRHSLDFKEDDHCEQYYYPRHNYELYLIKEDEEVLSSCSSYKYTNEDSKLFGNKIIHDEIANNALKELYQMASDYIEFGKDNFEKENIYDEYLARIPF